MRGRHVLPALYCVWAAAQNPKSMTAFFVVFLATSSQGQMEKIFYDSFVADIGADGEKPARYLIRTCKDHDGQADLPHSTRNKPIGKLADGGGRSVLGERYWS